jgi:aspartyl-tRNA(Asn)/glutamyl-tRNA(Gln) amidotransferase subunit B
MTTAETATGFQAVIGLEVHVELATRTKMFCGCPTDFGGDPNVRTCPVCLGQPGSLPVVNRGAVESAIRLGLALGGEVAPSSQFHRKNYFYPDMPKNYQISQYDVPICSGGVLEVTTSHGTTLVGITRVHMEEDTGKSLHAGTSGRIQGAEYSLVDYNRAGIPLLEVVSEPDIRSAEEAQAYLTELRAIVLVLGISDAKLEEGSMRCDANVSVHRPGEPFGARAEVKNMNSVRSLGRAIAYEVDRQVALVQAGGTVVLQTRHWDEDRGATSTLRVKETLEDYRYFPDPDLVAVEPEPAWIEELRAGLPELPAAIRRRLVDAHRLSAEQVATLAGAGLIPVFEEAVAAGSPPVDAVNLLTNDVIALASERGFDPADLALTGAQLAELTGLVTDGTLSTKLAREVLGDVLAGRGTPREVVAERGLEQISDTSELAAICDEVIAAQADAAQKVRDGNRKAVGALVGAVMRATQGRANPRVVNQLLMERLDRC